MNNDNTTTASFFVRTFRSSALQLIRAVNPQNPQALQIYLNMPGKRSSRAARNGSRNASRNAAANSPSGATAASASAFSRGVAREAKRRKGTSCPADLLDAESESVNATHWNTIIESYNKILAHPKFADIVTEAIQAIGARFQTFDQAAFESAIDGPSGSYSFVGCLMWPNPFMPSATKGVPQTSTCSALAAAAHPPKFTLS